MIAIVCGDRNWSDREYLFTELNRLHRRHGIHTVIEGEADGADKMAREWAQANLVPFWGFPAHWRHSPACPVPCPQVIGKPAGAIRNGTMLNALQRLLEAFPAEEGMVVAFHPNIAQSRGTRNMVQRAQRARIDVAILTGPSTK